MPIGRSGVARARRSRAGYSLVVLIMALAVLNIMIGAALPLWSERIRRDKEEELISRGFQYVEAIRVFQKRFQRYPTTFDELLKAKPRCIRQLWTDPMSDDGKFVPIFLGQGTQIQVPGQGDPNQNGLTPSTLQGGQNGQGSQNGSGSTPSDPNQAQNGSGFDPGNPQLSAVGPIVGVHSKSTQKSLLLFYGHDHYNEWEFRIEMLTRSGSNLAGAGGVPGIGVPNGSGGLALSTRWLGRPMPGFPTVPGSLMPGTIPGSGLGSGSGATGTPTGTSFGGSSSSQPSPSPGASSTSSSTSSF
jgi:type II secretory pathway pseudopilin PulG